MEFTDEDLLVKERVDEKIKENEAVIKDLLIENSDLNGLLNNLFLEKYEKYKPIINSFVEKGYHFDHPDVQIKTPMGPIIGFKEGKIFVLDVKKFKVAQINQFTLKVDEEYNVSEFVRRYFDFNQIINGLDRVLVIHKNLAEKLELENEKKRKILEEL